MPFYDDYEEFTLDSLYDNYDISPEPKQKFKAPEPEVVNQNRYLFEPEEPIDTFTADPEVYTLDEALDQYDFGGPLQQRHEERRAKEEEQEPGYVEGVGRSLGRAGENIRETVWSVLQVADRLPYAAAMAIKKRTDPEGYKILKENEGITKELFQKAAEGALGPLAEAVVPNEEFNKVVEEALGEIEEYRSGPFARSKRAQAGIYEGYKDLKWWTENTSDVAVQLAQVIGLNALAPGAGLVAIGGQAGTSQYQEAKKRMIERGFDVNDAEVLAAGEGAIMGILEGAMEYVPAQILSRVPGGKAKVFELAAQKYLGEAGGRLAAGAGAEALQEVGSEFAGDIMQLVAEEDPEAFNNWHERYLQAGALGAVGGIGVGGPGAAADVVTGPRRTDEDIADLLETKEGRDKLRALGEIESPSRKDFAEAGFTSRMNKEQREAITKSIPEMLKSMEGEEAKIREADRVRREEAAKELAKEPVEVEEETVPSGENVFPEQERDVVAKDIERTFRSDKDLATAAATVVQSSLTDEEVKQLHFEKGDQGQAEEGALYQIPEAVKAAKEADDWSSTTDEKKFFGTMWPKAVAAARKVKGAFKGAGGLGTEQRKVWGNTVKEYQKAYAEWEAKGKPGQAPTLKDPFKSGEAFEKTINVRGVRSAVAEAVKDLIPFVENKPEFQEYYRNEVAKERSAIAQKHSELATDDAAFQFYRMLNGVASAQTELFKNTQETERAYAGFKQSGRLPVVVDETGSKPRPQYALPKSSEFGATLPGEIDSIASAIAEMDSEIPDVFKENMPKRARLTKGDQSQLKKFTKKFKDRMNTTSDDLAANLWHEWKRDPEGFKTKVRTAFEIAGGSSAYNKARNYHVVNKLLDKFNGDLGKLMPWLNERVSVEELKKLNVEVGFSENIGGLNDIKDTVWVAEGQEAMIPRTFIFGPKVGAYILNRMADAHPQNANYNTMDVWESRVWRSYFKDLADADLGIASGVPRRVYMRAAREFPAEFKKQTGMDISVSAGQAARWYFGMEMMRKAGYSKVGDKQTIARYTQGVMEEYMRQELGAANPDMVVLEEGLRAISEAPSKKGAEAIAEQAELFKGSERKIGKEVSVKKLTKKQAEEAKKEAARLKQEEDAKREAQAEKFREEGAVVTQDVITTPSMEISSLTTLFQKSGEKILGSMREDADGKIILKGFEGSNVDTALEEIGHGIRRLVWRAHKAGGEKMSGLTNSEIKAIEKWAGKQKKGEEGWSVRMEERFAAGFRKFILENKAPSPILKSPFAKLRNFLRDLYTRIKSPAPGIRMNKEVQAAFDKILTRRERLTPTPTKKRITTDARQKGQAQDDTAEGAAAPEQRGFKAAEDEATEADTREHEVKALFPRRASVDQVGGPDAAAIAGTGGDNVPPEFIKEGKVTLYRYSHGDRGESYTIDPAKAQPRSYSRNDYERAKTPRTFFYLNTSEKEGIIGNNLYSAEVDAKDIYNLITDPQGLKEQFRAGNSYDFDGIFKVLMDQGKRGVYYNPGFHVVNLFDAVDAKSTPDVARKVDQARASEIWDGVQKQIRENAPAGFTFDPRTETFPTDGFAVAPAKSSEYVIDLSKTKSWEIPALIKEYAGMHAAKLAEGDMHLGGWVSEGKLYLDLSYVVPGKNVAVKIAKENNQLAIYDLGSGREIKTDDAADSASIYPNKREQAWTRDKGELKGEPISKAYVVDRILAFAGLKAGGNMSSKPPNVQAFYRRATTEISGAPAPGVEINMRRHEMANIGVAIHEVAHYLDDKLGLTNLGKYRGSDTQAGLVPTRQELAGSFAENLSDTEIVALTQESYEWSQPGDPATIKEGFAEALRLYIMNETPGDGFRSPLAVTAFERFLHDPRNSELREFVKEARGLVEQYMRQPLAAKIQKALAAGRSNVIDPGSSYFARQSKDWLGMKGAIRWVSRKFANSTVDLEAAEKEVQRRFKEWWGTLPDNARGGKDADQAWASLLTETGGLPSQMKQNHSNLTAHLVDKAIFDELTDQDGNKYSDSARSIFEDFDQKELETFGQYMYAKVALQRHDTSELDPITGRPSYVPGEVDIADLREFVRQVDNSKFQKAAKDTTKYFNSLLQMMVDNNLILQHEYDSMVATHQLYMPFYRQFADENHGLGGRFLGVQAPIKKLKGGSVMPVLDVFDAMVDRTHEVIGAINRRQVEQTFIDVFEKSGSAGIFMSRVEKKSEGGANVVTILRNGVEVHYKLDPDIYDAMVMSGHAKMAEPVARILDTVGSVTSLGRKLLVNYNFLFPFRNYPRDFKTAAIKGLMDTTGLDPNANPWMGIMSESLKNAPKIWRTARPNTQVDKLYADMGGGHNTRVSAADRQTRGLGVLSKAQKSFRKRRAFGKPTTLTSALMKAANGLHYLEMLNEHLELVPRKAAFHATLVGLGFADKAGNITGPVPQWAKTRAMSNAMEVTVNFNRRGEWAPVLGKLFLFYNAAVQGSFVNRAQVFTDPKARARAAKAIAIGFMAKGAALAAMAMMPSPEDEEKTILDHYWEIPDYYKKLQDNFLFNVNGRVYGLQLPKEREFAFASRLYEKMWEHILGAPTASDDTAISTIGDEMLELLSESLPITGGTLPTALQLYFGYDVFRDQPIEGKWDDDKLVSERYDDRTSAMAKFMSQNVGLHNLGLSPKEMDFIFRSVGLGTISTYMDLPSKWGDKLPFMMNETPRQSSSDLYVKSQENRRRFNAWSDGKEYSEAETKEILRNEEIFGVAEDIAKAIRESSMSDDDKAKYTTGLARWALDRKPVADWPNPLVEYNALPPDVKQAVAKAFKSLGQKPRLTDKSPAGVKGLKQRAEAKAEVTKKLRGLK